MATTERIVNGTPVAARLNWDIVATGLLVNAASEVLCEVEGASWLAVDIRDVFNLTWVVEGTREGSGYMQLPIYPAGQLGAPVAQLAGSAQGLYWVRISGFKTVRVRTTTWTSGSAIISLATCMSNFPPIGVQGPEPLPLLVRPALVAANTAVTVNIPAPGVGLYQMIHQIKVWGHNNSGAAVAPTATFAITSSNLNGVAWNNINDFPIWTKKVLIDMDVENGMRAQNPNTAVTIAIPALGAGVVTEALVLYKNGA